MPGDLATLPSSRTTRIGQMAISVRHRDVGLSTTQQQARQVPHGRSPDKSPAPRYLCAGALRPVADLPTIHASPWASWLRHLYVFSLASVRVWPLDLDAYTRFRRIVTASGQTGSEVDRLTLLIASQCEAMGELSFLPPGDFSPAGISEAPPLVFDLYRALTDPRAGNWGPVPGLEETVPPVPRDTGLSCVVRPGFVVNPTLAQAKEALKHAMLMAHREEAMLLVYYVGHGYAHRPQLDPRAWAHFLQVWDTAEMPASDDDPYRGWNLYDDVGRLRRDFRHLRGLVLVVDACEASFANDDVARWSSAEAQFRGVWLGSSRTTPAYDGCFTTRFADLLDQGLPAAEAPNGELLYRIRADTVAWRLEGSCPDQKPVQQGYQDWDPAMYIAVNQAAGDALESDGLGGAGGEYLLELVRDYEPHRLREVIAAAATHRLTLVVGDAGTGKSTLAAALRRPPLLDPPALSVDAVAFAGISPTASELAKVLSVQLGTIPQFRQASHQYHHFHQQEWVKLSIAEQRLWGPLTIYRKPVTLVIDGLDRLSDPNRPDVLGLIDKLTADDTYQHVHVIATSRPANDLPPHSFRMDQAKVDQTTAQAYLDSRGISGDRQDILVELAQGSWLVLALAADYLKAGGDAEIIEGRPGAIYESMLGAAEKRLGSELIQSVLTVLTAAVGAGPVLPYPLFRQAVVNLEPASDRSRIDLVIADRDIHRIISRTDPGSDQELLGFFHPTVAEWLTASGRVDVERGHWAIHKSIQQVAPRSNHNLRSPVHHYAYIAEAEHAWQAGQHDDVIHVLEARTGPRPTDTLNGWLTWQPRIAEHYPVDDRHRLITRMNIARWTGEAGNPAEALRLLKKLLPTMKLKLGSNDAQTLAIRSNIARWTGEAGSAAEARDLFEQVLRQMEEEFAAKDRETLKIRNDFAYWTGEAGNAAEARDLYEQVLRQTKEEFGAEHRETLKIRNSFAYWTGKADRPKEAVSILEELIPQMEELLGCEDVDTLRARTNIATWIGKARTPGEALTLFEQLLPQMEEIFGPDHPDTLNAQFSIAHWTGEAHDPAKALVLLGPLFSETRRVLGPDHRNTLLILEDIARWTGEAGNPAEALTLFGQLLPRMEKVFGQNHPETLRTRNAIAYWTAEPSRPPRPM